MPRSSRQTPARKVTHSTKPASGEPLYRQVVEALRHEIVKGIYPVDTQLPTELTLCERFGVSRHTIREALRHLRADGLISSRRGSGTTVMLPPKSEFNVHRVASIDELIAYAVASRYVVNRSDLVVTDDALASELGVPVGKRWLRLQGFRQRDDETLPPLSWTVVYVAAEYAGVERLMGRQRASIWSLIEDMYGERLVEVEQQLRVTPVPPGLAQGLGVAADSTVIEIRRRYFNTANKIVEIAINLYPSETFRFTMKLRRA